MKAVLCKKLGGPEDLVVEDVPSPVPGGSTLMVRAPRSASIMVP